MLISKQNFRRWGLSTFFYMGIVQELSFALGSSGYRPIFSKANGIYKATKGSVTCADHAKLRNTLKIQNGKIDDLQTVFWEASGNQVANFVFYDTKSRVISICDDGKIINVQGPGNATDKLEIDVSNANLGDWNGDGKRKLLISEKQCFEGPCIGSTFILQVQGDHLTKLYDISSDLVEFTNAKLPLQLRSYCFSYEFVVAFDFLSLVDRDERRNLILIPHQQIHKRFPAILKEYAARKRQGQNESIAYKKIQNLIIDALYGEKQDVLIEKLNSLVKPFGTRGLPIYCEPATIISLLAAPKS